MPPSEAVPFRKELHFCYGSTLSEMVSVMGIFFLIPGCSQIPAFNKGRLCLMENAAHLEDTKKKSYTKCRSIEGLLRGVWRDT